MAKLADFPVQRLITSSAAAVYAFAARHPDVDTPVLIVDVGSGYATATLTQSIEGTHKILASECTRTGGSRQIDHGIFGMVAKECVEKHQVEVKLCSGLGMRLLKQCEGTKKVLSMA